jgi:putative DNA methylase
VELRFHLFGHGGFQESRDASVHCDIKLSRKENLHWSSMRFSSPRVTKMSLTALLQERRPLVFAVIQFFRPKRVRAQLREQRGGADVVFDESMKRSGGARLLSVVIVKPGEQGRFYRLPKAADYQAVWKAKKQLGTIISKTLPNGLSRVPDEERPESDADRVRPYGMTKFSDLTSSRQQLSLAFLVTKIVDVESVSIQNMMAMVLGRCVDYWSTGALWAREGEFIAHTFGLQVIPIGWDFAEAAPWADSSGNFEGAIDWVARVVEKIPKLDSIGQVQLADACDYPLPGDSGNIWFTDPPYYDAVRYADLSDSFFVWLKRALPNNSLLNDPFDPFNTLTPKLREAVQDEIKQVNGCPKNRSFFEKTMAKAFAEGNRILRDDGIGCVVFAHKTTEGWEALLSGMIQGGWVITGSWPIVTERPGRLRSQDSAALATSVHLVCRPRPEDASVGDWGDVLRELPGRVGDWMERLQSEGIRGADLVFACIGPALEIFSRYSKVETAEGREVKLAEYLEKVWEVVGRTALEQVLGTEAAKARNGAAGAVEEDARLTALFLWTLQSTDGNGNNLTEKSPHPPFAKGGYSGEGSAKIRNVVKDLAKGQAEDGSRKSLTLEKGGEGGFSEDIESGEEDDEDASTKGKQKGFTLVFDVVRRFAQPLGIHLPEWEGRIIETKKGVVRLFSIAERAKQLFGEDGAQAIADKLESSTEESLQLALFSGSQEGAAPQIKGRGRQRKSGVSVSEESLKEHRGATTLDRVHAVMLLQASGRANALRALLKAEVERSPDFLRLANALSALYPKGSEEKRLVDAMLLAMPR